LCRPLRVRAEDARRAMSEDLGLFERILLATDGTVTELVALYAGEAIRVRKLEQRVLDACTDERLACAPSARLLDRRILLVGATRAFLYAESQFVLDRLAPAMRDALLGSDRPIGLVWKEARLETFREVVERSIAPCAELARHFDVARSTPFVSRTYVVHHGGRPLGVITEKWPRGAFTSRSGLAR
jgi:chorismate-pyruvate lyase